MTTYLYAGAAVILALLAGAVTVQTSRLSACKAEFESFKLKAKTLGEKAERDAKDKEAADLLKKRTADNENAKTRAADAATIKRLRDASSAGRGLSAPATSAASPERSCFDHAKFSAALRRLDEGILGIVETGSKAVTDLDTAKRWANP